MKKIISIIFLLTILVTPLVLADSIADAQITLKVYNTTKYVNGSVVINLEVINGDYSGNNKNYSLNITNGKLISSSNDFKFQLVKNGTLVENLDYLNKYTQCLEEKAGFERGWQFCQNDLLSYNGENVSNCKTQLDNCNLGLKEKDLTINSLNEDVQDLENEQNNSKNQKWIFGVLGVLFGALGYAFKEGKIGNSVKEKSYDEFHRGGTG